MGFHQRKTDNRVVTASDRFNETAAFTLNAVGSRFIHRLTAGNVVGNVLLRQRAKRHVGHHQRAALGATIGQRDRSHHLMLSP